MIEPINNVLEQNGDFYLVVTNGLFNNVFSKETDPTLFSKSAESRTYLGFLHDSNPPTLYEVYRWHSTPRDQPLKIRRLSVRGAKRAYNRWINPMLQSYIDRANAHIQQPVAKFREDLIAGDIVEAEKDIGAVVQSLEITVSGCGLLYEYVRLPEGLYDRLETCPEKLMKELTPERYRKSVAHYLERAGDEGDHGRPNAVNRLCDNAKFCAEKGYDADSLQSILESIQKVRDGSFAGAKSIERDREIVSRFSWRRPNSRESFLVAELGYDPFPKPTAKDYAEISAAERRLESKGLR
jgi:hypothetical protein